MYNVILADPPWSFSAYSDKAWHHVNNHYATMTEEAIKSIPVASLASDTCLLFMWATWPNLQTALDVGAAWGFTYKTIGFNWVKMNKKSPTLFTGLGYYTRSNTEPCLLFRYEKMPALKSRSVHSVIQSPIRGHSQKPEETYTRIETLLDGPYIELFARNQRVGWDSIGNEIDGQDINETIKRLTQGNDIP